MSTDTSITVQCGQLTISLSNQDYGTKISGRLRVVSNFSQIEQELGYITVLQNNAMPVIYTPTQQYFWKVNTTFQ